MHHVSIKNNFNTQSPARVRTQAPEFWFILHALKVLVKRLNCSPSISTVNEVPFDPVAFKLVSPPDAAGGPLCGLCRWRPRLQAFHTPAPDYRPAVLRGRVRRGALWWPCAGRHCGQARRGHPPQPGNPRRKGANLVGGRKILFQMQVSNFTPAYLLVWKHCLDFSRAT